MIKIALADDHPQVREIWNYILSANTAFRVVSNCRNGQEAIAAASAHLPDVMIMDINMQPVNGIEATAVIAKMHPQIKIIGMSIHADGAYVRRMLQAGAHGYITKNADYHEVFEAIMQVTTGQYYLCHEVQSKIPGLQVAS